MLEWLEKYTKVKREILSDLRREWLWRYSINNIQQLDETRANNFVKNIYKRMKLDEPETIIVDDPKELQRVAFTIPKPNINSNVISNMHSRAWDDLWNRMVKKFNNEMGIKNVKEIHNLQRSERTKNLFGNIVSRTPAEITWETSRSMIQIRQIVNRTIVDESTNRITNGIPIIMDHAHTHVLSDTTWATFYQFLVATDIIEPESDLDGYMDGYLSNMFEYLPLWNTCIICKPPISVSINDDNRIHNSEGYAIDFNGDYGQHYLHGIYFDKEIYKRYQNMDISASEVLKMENIEQRMALIKELGYEYILKEVNAKVIDKYKGRSKITKKPVKYELIEFEMDFGFDTFRDENKFRLVKVEDHTTHKEVLIGVPINQETETCLGAIAWTFKMTEQEYKPFLES